MKHETKMIKQQMWYAELWPCAKNGITKPEQKFIESIIKSM